MSSKLYTMIHDDDHDKKHEKSKDEEKVGLTAEKQLVWAVLDLYEATPERWIDPGELKKRVEQPHCTVEFAQAWREWWLAVMAGEHKYTNPAGFANKQMRRGHSPPPLQINLPESSLDLAALQAAMQENPPIEGATFDPVSRTWH
jgi:hypothetical protein